MALLLSGILFRVISDMMWEEADVRILRSGWHCKVILTAVASSWKFWGMSPQFVYKPSVISFPDQGQYFFY